MFLSKPIKLYLYNFIILIYYYIRYSFKYLFALNTLQYNLFTAKKV